MKTYDQSDVDARFESLIQRCRDLGFHQLADHYAGAQGMQRGHAVRFLEAMFEVREQNLRRNATRVWFAFFILAATALLLVIIQKGTP